MTGLKEKPTKEEVLEFISESSSFGNLGMFVGAGFSKAVLNSSFNDIALSWSELLEKCSEKMDIEYDEIYKTGVGYPDIATNICEIYAEKKEIEYDQALKKLKREIAKLTSWYPEKEKREEYANYLNRVNPSWVITTNYDLVLESLLTGKCVPLEPSESMCAPQGMTPVYHLHGIRSNPDSIIISQEDYVTLFRPNEYRQIKLALTIKESTVLLLGYGLGDVNVLTALDWSNNVFGSKNGNYPNEVIQVVRKENPSPDTYRDRNGIIIYEVSDLTSFFSEFNDINDIYKEQQEKQTSELLELSKTLEDPDQELLNKFIDEKEFRDQVLKILSKFTSSVISSFVSFLNKVFDETWGRAEPNGAFYAYDENLIIQLDILTTLNLDQIPPALLETVAYNLNRVSEYVGRGMGESHAADRTFVARKSELTRDTVLELRNIAEQHGYYKLTELMRRIDV